MENPQTSNRGQNRGKAGRTRDELLAELAPERRPRVEAHAAELMAEVGLR